MTILVCIQDIFSSFDVFAVPGCKHSDQGRLSVVLVKIIILCSYVIPLVIPLVDSDMRGRGVYCVMNRLFPLSIGEEKTNMAASELELEAKSYFCYADSLQ